MVVSLLFAVHRFEGADAGPSLASSLASREPYLSILTGLAGIRPVFLYINILSASICLMSTFRQALF